MTPQAIEAATCGIATSLEQLHQVFLNDWYDPDGWDSFPEWVDWQTQGRIQISAEQMSQLDCKISKESDYSTKDNLVKRELNKMSKIVSGAKSQTQLASEQGITQPGISMRRTRTIQASNKALELSSAMAERGMNPIGPNLDGATVFEHSDLFAQHLTTTQKQYLESRYASPNTAVEDVAAKYNVSVSTITKTEAAAVKHILRLLNPGHKQEIAAISQMMPQLRKNLGQVYGITRDNRTILTERFCAGKTAHVVAEEWGMCVANIRGREKRALERIHTIMNMYKAMFGAGVTASCFADAPQWFAQNSHVFGAHISQKEADFIQWMYSTEPPKSFDDAREELGMHYSTAKNKRDSFVGKVNDLLDPSLCLIENDIDTGEIKLLKHFSHEQLDEILSKQQALAIKSIFRNGAPQKNSDVAAEVGMTSSVLAQYKYEGLRKLSTILRDEHGVDASH